MNALNKLTASITAYQLFALTVLIMIMGHASYYFFPDISWLRIPDRMLAPVFLVCVGFNSGYKLSNFLIVGAILVIGMTHLIMGTFYVNILGTIVLVRYLIEPMANLMIKNKEFFWIINALLVVLYPITNTYIEYGTVAIIMAMAGWLIRNSEAIDNKVISPQNYFFFAFIIYVLGVQLVFMFSEIQVIVLSLGTAFVMYLLYHMRDLLLNSIRDKSKNLFKRIYKFIGKKSLEVYVIHIILFQIIYFLRIAHS